MSPGLLTALAWRNLRRNVRRSLLLVAAVSVGVGGLVMMAALLRGWLDSTVDVALDALNGHVRVHDPAWLEDPGAADRFVLDAALGSRLDDVDGVERWAPRIRIPAVLMSERESRGVMLVGIDPAREPGLSFIGDASIDGSRLAGIDASGVLLGRALVEDLETDLGKRVVFMFQDVDGETVERGYRVVGVFDEGGEGLEKGFAFTGIRALRGVAGLGPAEVTEVSLRLDRRAAARLEAVTDALAGALPGLAVRSWRDLTPQAAAMVDMSRSSIWVIYLVTMVALGFGLVNTLLASVIERVRELGLLQAVGMRPSGIVGQVVIESWMVLTLGLVLGLVLGVGGVRWLSDGIDLGRWAGAAEMAGMSSLLVPVLEARDLVQIVAVVAVLGLLASIYPARKAVSIDPLEAIMRNAE